MLATKPDAENKLFQPAPAESGVNFSEVLHGSSKNYDVRLPGVISPEDLGIQSTLSNGETVTVSSMFDIGSDDDPRAMAIVTMHDPRSDTYRVSLGGLVADESGKLRLNNAWVPLNKDSGVMIGRLGDRGTDTVVGSESLWPGTGYFASDVSRRHVSLFFDGRNISVLDTSTGGTKFYKNGDSISVNVDDDFGHLSEHTLSAKEAARVRGLLKESAGNEEFSGRSVIDRDTVDPEGKVDIRSWVGGGEAIVVDSEKDPVPFARLLDKCTKIIEDKGVFTETDLLQAIYDTVSATMKYDLDYVDSLSKSLTGKSRKVSLGAYLEDGRGVCRHMALASQWLGARMCEKYPQLLNGGKFTTPVNQRTKDNSAHEWVRYTSPRGKVFIIDVAQKFVGTLEAVAEQSGRGKKRWEYFASSEEKKQYELLIAGRTAVKGSLFRKFKRK